MKPAAIVTGAASGIGLVTAERLLDDGWPVAFLDADAERLGEAEESFEGEEAVFLHVDVTDEEEVAEAFDTAVDALGPVGALVNSAGIARALSFEETGAELMRRILDVNLVGSFIACKAAVERMADQLSIVNLSSVSGLRGNRDRVAYGASKAGVRLMTEVMAVELAERQVRANCVAPGPVDTPLVMALHSERDRADWVERIPQGRYARTEEVAAAIAFLVSPEASYINGHTLVIDGGFQAAGLMK